jgi:Protein of unknown function (DUF3551)
MRMAVTVRNSFDHCARKWRALMAAFSFDGWIVAVLLFFGLIFTCSLTTEAKTQPVCLKSPAGTSMRCNYETFDACLLSNGGLGAATCVVNPNDPNARARVYGTPMRTQLAG